ncbi:MAG: methyl-accepting chemotaxis protein [Clostridiales Family XIII bacterium]|jgi:methyl-accepting chemotaxis protein|nr:methyl-accepting chemotaxis protein [Clostridiales Family XIII bacterium]
MLFPLLIFSYNWIKYFVESEAGPDAAAMIRTLLIVYIVAVAVGAAIILYFSFQNIKYVTTPLTLMAKTSAALSVGDTSVDLNYAGDDDVGQVAANFRQVLNSIKYEQELLERMADGDYEIHLDLRSEKDDMFRSINEIVDKMAGMISGIQEIANKVYIASSEVSSTSTTLASGANEQTASVAFFAKEINDLRLQAARNSETAGTVSLRVDDNMQKMKQISKDMDGLDTAMQNITESTRRMMGIIKVIEDIAFQTNILALNAAVEAARAGAHGRGFAVVADEVRTLAARSSDAVKETSELIRVSDESVENGNHIVKITKTGIGEIEKILTENSASTQELSSVSIQQSHAVDVITEKLDRIAETIQANAAMAEESSASASNLNTQSEHLKDLVSAFKVKSKQERDSF